MQHLIQSQIDVDMNKSLSVIICNYNHARYLPEALEAILSQSYRPLEVIVIDDASTDNSVAVIEKFRLRNSIVRLYRNQKNQGVLRSANFGVRLAAGDYLYWGAADDRVCRGFFQNTMETLARYEDAGLCSALITRLGENGEDLGWIRTPIVSNVTRYFSPDEVIKNLTDYGFWFTGQTTIYRRDVILRETEGFIPELMHRSDHFVDLVIAAKYGACFIPKKLATYRILDTGYAQAVFKNEAESRRTFELLIWYMRQYRYRSIFSEIFIDKWERRGAYDLELMSLSRVAHNAHEFIARLRALQTRDALLDRLFFCTLETLVRTWRFAAKVYLWHKQINWNFRWLIMKIRTRYSTYNESL